MVSVLSYQKLPGKGWILTAEEYIPSTTSNWKSMTITGAGLERAKHTNVTISIPAPEMVVRPLRAYVNEMVGKTVYVYKCERCNTDNTVLTPGETECSSCGRKSYLALS